MAWFIAQSLLIVLATFVLGLIIGWLWWGRIWRRVPFGESEAVRLVRYRYRAVLAEREAEITQLDQRLQTAELSVIDLRDAATARAGGAGAEATPGASGTGSGTDSTPVQQAVPGDPAEDTAPATDEPPLVEATEPDDLQRIEGIGPRIAAALEGAGLHTFRALAQANGEQLSAALREARLSFAPSLVTWPLQARLLAAGEEETFAALKAEMTAGRGRPSRASADEESAAPGESAPGESTAPGEPTAVPDTEPIPVLDAADDPDDAAAAPGTGSPVSPTGSGPAGSDASASAGSSPAGSSADEHDGEADEDDEDELERVEGIGPRIATALRKAGIHTYRELAATDAATLQAALAASGLRFTPSLPTWSRQAALLADGDEAGFLELTRTLVPERETGRPSA